jgi:hypothetical protein
MSPFLLMKFLQQSEGKNSSRKEYYKNNARFPVISFVQLIELSENKA